MSDRPRTRCPTCERAIEPDETDVVEAVEIVPVPGFGEGLADDRRGQAGRVPSGLPGTMAIPAGDACSYAARASAPS